MADQARSWSFVSAVIRRHVDDPGKAEKAFKCPDCGGPVNDALDTDGKANTPILRLCPSCDVLWQTGAIPD